LYGTAAVSTTAWGKVFKLTHVGKQSVLYTFQGGADGNHPTSDLVRDSTGNLYGTTQYGGDLSCEPPIGCGTVFRVDSAGHETVLYSFKGGTDGMFPNGVIRDEDGNLYGTTVVGGDHLCGYGGGGCGTVFKISTTGRETVLHTFTGGADSGYPDRGLVMDAKSNLYGATHGVAGNDYGAVFKVTKGGKETVLYAFGSDGNAPTGSLVMDAKGNLYGTTSGDFGGLGTVFKLTRDGKETVLYNFKGPPDGSTPQAGVVMDTAGNLYGTTYAGGDATCSPGEGGGCGTVFKLTKSGNESVLYRFTDGLDGAFPGAPLLLDAKGNLYGTTPYGGHSNYCNNGGEGCGVVFEMTPK
jgi:uncharacterized repeat protein (TIGR03803 family)